MEIKSVQQDIFAEEQRCTPSSPLLENCTSATPLITFLAQTHHQRHTYNGMMGTEIVNKAYKCQICQKEFQRSSRLTCHMMLHTGEKPYKCDICKKGFASLDYVRAHIKDLHIDQQSFKCQTCGKGFDRDYRRKRHELIHTGEKPHKCNVCQKGFARSDHLIIHMKNHHTGEKPYTCNISDKVSCTASLLQMETDAEKKPFKCRTCGQRFDRQGKLKCHELTHIAEKLHKCNMCQRTFTCSDQLRTHISDHLTGEKPYIAYVRTKTGKNSFKCQTCFKAFNGESALKCHELTHTGEKPYKCNMCDKACARRDNLQAHIRNMHTGEIRHKCNVCRRTFTSSDQLETHIRDHHTGEIRHKCNVCRRAFTFSDQLETHIRDYHTEEIISDEVPCTDSPLHRQLETDAEEKLFKCHTCGKGFDRPSQLKSHELTHVREKTHKCNMCQRIFAWSDQLKTHMRDHHTGDNPYIAHMHTKSRKNFFKCQTCGKGFDRERDMKCHVMIHTGEKPHKCNLCQRAFTRSDQLKKHTRTHTGERSYTCHLCLKIFAQNEVLQQHLKTHTEERWYLCNLCQKTFALSLQRHPKTKTMRCVSCFQGNMFRVVDRYYFQSLSPEDDIDQLPEMPYGCGICDELFETEKEFVKHCYHHYTGSPHKDTFIELLQVEHLRCYF